MEAVKIAAAIEDIRPHIPAWITLLETHIASLPRDTTQAREDRSYAEQELQAMKRDLGALLAAADH